MSEKLYYTTIDSDIGQLKLEIVYDYDGGEKGDGYLQPDVFPEVSIRDVKIVGVDHPNQMDWLEEEIYEHETQ